MKYFESNFTMTDNLKNFLNKFENYTRIHRDYTYIINYWKFPDDVEYEVAVLYFLYTDTNNAHAPNWKSGDKKVDNSIKRQVKRYILNLLHEKYNDNPDIYHKIRLIFNNNKQWYSTRTAVDKYVLFNFHTSLKKPSDFIIQSNKFNL